MKIIISFIQFLVFTTVVYAQSSTPKETALIFLSDSLYLEEVEVKSKRTPAANSRWSNMSPVELAVGGGANGDLYRALQTLPGTQLEGETGKLLVRGGDNSETQTYIDGMHVLNPYTTNGINTPSRGRYSTFMFSGINLASGAAPLEYGNALSAALPLETKDISPINKLGINVSSVGVGTGGTRAFEKGSASVNFEYQDLAPYNKLYSGRTEYKDPYRLMSASTQLRFTPTDNSIYKIYCAYDRTDFSNYEGHDRRLFKLDEDNLYLNATYRNTTSAQWNWFVGTAFSWYRQKIDNANLANDGWEQSEQEVHLKIKTMKKLNALCRIEMGAESLINQYDDSYRLYHQNITIKANMNSTQTAAYATLYYFPIESIKTELSIRGEYTSLNREWNLSPRLCINYYLGNLMLSAAGGRYTQLPGNRYLANNNGLRTEVCTQYNLGAQYNYQGRFMKAEIYYKQYSHLVLGTLPTVDCQQLLTSQGHGYSRGVDLFFQDAVTIKRLEYQLSYTYNDSKRKYREYEEMTTPQYITKHNASLVLKYTIPTMNLILGLTNRFSSGRPFHNPLYAGIMNDRVKPYNSLDFALTYLATRKIIVHASASNILARKNVFGKVNGQPIYASSDHFFYVGVFITLGKKAAYDVSNF